METLEDLLKKSLYNAALSLGASISFDDVIIEHSKDKAHGDFASNIAMRLTSVLKKNPREIATSLISLLNVEGIDKVEIAGPGFMNFFIKLETLNSVVTEILEAGENYGSSDFGKNLKVNIEFVSANPTGDLHLGHARGAAIGDSIARIYKKAGFDVTREYYLNDAGNQMDNLGASFECRYHEALGLTDLSMPENGYFGEDIKKFATDLVASSADKYIIVNDDSHKFFKELGGKLEFEKINQDLKDFRCTFDVFSSEVAIRNSGLIEEVLEKLKPYTYMEDGALYLKTTQFADDKDRVIIKSDGSYTYLLPDIAYHLDKLNRGFSKLIDCLGADHHGYIARMNGALSMLGYKLGTLEIELIQMVRLLKDGEEFKMSKRTGNAVSMRELVSEVGLDAVRYFFVSRANSAHLDFDLDLAKEMSSKNPVYYSQYAHARLSRMLEAGTDIEIDKTGQNLKENSEKELLKKLQSYQLAIIEAASARAPHKIVAYIEELASLISRFYVECKVIDRENIKVTSSRLALVKAAKIVLKDALSLIGVSAPDNM